MGIAVDMSVFVSDFVRQIQARNLSEYSIKQYITLTPKTTKNNKKMFSVPSL